MKTFTIGNGALEVSALGLGCMSMSGLYGAADDGDSIATIHMAIDLGINFLDTSVSYGSGHNQALLGKALRDRRDKVIVHSKFGVLRNAEGHSIGMGASPETARQNCEESLTRFGFDTIDIWCPSRPDPDVPVEDTVGEMVRLKEEGKIRFLGVSEAATHFIRRAAAVHPLVTLQMEYSLLSRDLEAAHIGLCKELDMGIMAYAPFARGLLTETLTPGQWAEGDTRAKHERFTGPNLEKNLALLETARGMAAEKGVSVPQLAIAFSAARGAPVIPFPSAKTRAHLEANVAAMDIELSPEDMARLEAAYPPGCAAGGRYPAASLAQWHGPPEQE